MKYYYKRFKDNADNISWDYAIREIECYKNDHRLQILIRHYWNGYMFEENNDCDSGICWEIRNTAIQNIRTYLKEKEKDIKYYIKVEQKNEVDNIYCVYVFRKDNNELITTYSCGFYELTDAIDYYVDSYLDKEVNE